MRIIARRTLREFVEGRRGYKDHAALKAALDAWFDEVRKARWSSAAEVKRSYATASIVSADRIVFNIKGNDYRLVVAVDFEKSIVWIKRVAADLSVKSVPMGGQRSGAKPQTVTVFNACFACTTRCSMDPAASTGVRARTKPRNMTARSSSSIGPSADMIQVWNHYEREARDLTRVLGRKLYRDLL